MEELVFRAGTFPTDGDWSATVDAHVGEAERFDLTFVRYAGGRESDKIILGSTTVFELDRTRIEAGPLPGEAMPWDTLESLAALQPPAFSSWATERLDRLGAVAVRALDEGRVERCAHGEYTGDEAVRCARIPLPAAEVPARRRWVDSELARAREHVRTDSVVLHGLVADLIRTPR